jgi:glyoxylate carboligase
MFGTYEPGQLDPRSVVDNLLRAQHLLAGHLESSVFQGNPPVYRPPSTDEVQAALALAMLAHAQTLALVAAGGEAEEHEALTKVADVAMQPNPAALLRGW